MPFAAMTNSSWTSILVCIPFIGVMLRTNDTSRYSVLAARIFEISLIAFGGYMAIRDQGIRNEEAIKALRREDNIIQIALVTEVGRLQETNRELRDTLKEFSVILTEHRINHP